jgi:hypothetical protein
MPNAIARGQLTRYYYLATPVFFLADLLWDAPVRASFIGDPRVRYAYYAACFGCGIVMWQSKTYTKRIGIVECLVNFTMVIFSIMVPVINAPDAILAGADRVYDPAHPINAGLSGLMLLNSYYTDTGVLSGGANDGPLAKPKERL